MLKILDAESENTAQKGGAFEQLVKAFLEQDKAQSARFDEVWHWAEWEGNQNQHDIGIDLVARERDSGELVAIQCKFYRPGTSIALDQLNKFLAAYSVDTFASGIFVSTSEKWTGNAEKALSDRKDKPVSRWGPDVFENSSIDWSEFSFDRPSEMAQKEAKTLRNTSRKRSRMLSKGLESMTAAS